MTEIDRIVNHLIENEDEDAFVNDAANLELNKHDFQQIIGLAYSPTDQDFMAKIMNFSKWNAPIPERPPNERPIKS